MSRRRVIGFYTDKRGRKKPITARRGRRAKTISAKEAKRVSEIYKRAAEEMKI